MREQLRSRGILLWHSIDIPAPTFNPGPRANASGRVMLMHCDSPLSSRLPSW